LALQRDYLETHAIGAVVVTGRAKEAAALSRILSPVRTGTYDVYRVERPTTVVTFAGTATAIDDLDDQGLVATGESAGGEALIRRNWFPRWRATVNGQAAAITRTADGYMSVAIPPGPVRLELTYGVDGIDWFGRLLSLSGVLTVAWLVLTSRLGGRPR
jgi:hypothetical protein